MTGLSDGVAALLAEPESPLVHYQLLDWFAERGRDVRQSALRLVSAHRDADGPRLLFAEWCDRNGQPERAEFVRVQVALARLGPGERRRRAEFIRVQCELAKLGADPDAVAGRIDGKSRNRPPTAYLRRWLLERRERELWGAGIADALLKESPSLVGVHLDPIRDEGVRACVGRPARGFIDTVTAPAAEWLAHGDAVRAAHPVTRVRLTSLPEFGVHEGTVRLTGDPRLAEFAWEAVVAASSAAAPGERFSRRIAAGALHLRYPGVEFELPGVGRTTVEGIP